MTIRLFGALLCGAALLLATQTDLAQGQSRATNQALGGNFKSKNVKPLAERGSPGKARATTVKSSKSNTSDR